MIFKRMMDNRTARMAGFRGILLLSILLPFLSGCGCRVSLDGYDIDPNAKTFTVGNFKLKALNAPATISNTFQELLKDKVARQSRLKYIDIDGDLNFEGTIQNYLVSAVAPQPNEQTSFNRLMIYVEIEYTNHIKEGDQWTKTFSHFADFPTDQNLLQVQDELIVIIFNQILEDVFNQAFTNW